MISSAHYWHTSVLFLPGTLVDSTDQLEAIERGIPTLFVMARVQKDVQTANT